MLAPSFPPDVTRFIDKQVAVGNYASQEDVVVDAVRILREVQVKQRQFHEDVRLGMEQLERGEYTEYDEAGLRQLFDDLKQNIQESAKRGDERAPS
jgi:Arc/MetJ-type ribon-helix-helix transcriptional regulator